jgi:hypothetical protein
MSFSIQIHSRDESPREIAPGDTPAPAHGVIRLGEYQEELTLSQSMWMLEDYEAHWKSALDRVLAGKKTRLITDMCDPRQEGLLKSWLFYPDPEAESPRVLVQHQMMACEHVPPFLSTGEVCSYVPGFKEVSDEGLRLQTWTISIQELREFREHFAQWVEA